MKGIDAGFLAIMKADARKTRFFNLFTVALILPVIMGQSLPAVPERISFPHENVSDLRGYLNAFAAFRRACLDYPVSPELPEQIVPEGYQVVTQDVHWWGEDSGAFPSVRILSRTGREESDIAGGHPIIELTMPADDRPNGACKVVWKRTWDYPADQVGDILFRMAVLFDARVSYYLASMRASRPVDGFEIADKYPIFSEWMTGCWGTNEPCTFVVSANLDRETGIDLSISRDR
jgi:hypothetical protein